MIKEVINSKKISAIFKELSFLIEFHSSNDDKNSSFKSKSYLNASRAILDSRLETSELLERLETKDIRGIGKSIKRDLDELVKSGSLGQHLRLVKMTPEGVFKLRAVSYTHLTLPTICSV